MPSPYSPPEVQVEQRRRTAIAQRLAPLLPPVVVGPARLIVVRENAGLYEATEEFQATLPALTSGAVVDADSLEVLLDARDAAGKSLGLFALSLSAPADAELLSDDKTLRVISSLALEYSILSARNNNQPNSVADDDRSDGTPEGIYLTDADVDFLGRGATLAGDTFVIIDAPASMGGRYKVIGFVPTGDKVNTVILEKVDADGVAELSKSVTLDNANAPTTAVIYGFPAAHFLGTAPGGSNTNNILSAGIGLGIGVEEQIEISTGKTELDATDLTALLAVGDLFIPDEDSGDQVWFEPAAGGVGSGQGDDLQAWKDAVAAVKAGDWMRFEGDFGGGSAEIRDFKIISVDTENLRLLIQNPDLTGTGTFTLDSGAGTWPDVDAIKFLKVLKGSSDSLNAAGDFVYSDAFKLEIVKATPGYIQVKSTVPAISADTPVDLKRGIPFRNSLASYDLRKRVTEGFEGDVLVSYQADRTDLSLNGLISLGSIDDVETQLGLIHPDNPLALGCDMVLRSGLADANRVFYALATDGDTLADYQAALDALSSEDVYSIVPLTQDAEIIDLFRAHVEAQSLPENKHERILLATSVLPTTDLVLPASTGAAVPSGTVHATDANRFDTAEDLGEVKPGMVLRLLSSASLDATVVAEHRITVVNETSGFVETIDDFDVDLQGASFSFRIDTYPRTKLEQAEAWRDEAAAIGSSRVMFVRPDEIEITYTDKTGDRVLDRQVIVPSYYAACAFAGLAAVMPPQAPMTNVDVPGVGRLLHSNTYFTPDQLNTIAEGGNNILVQATRRSAPFSRHQLMSDMTSLITREFSIIKAVDFAAKMMRNSLRPYVGSHNITTEYLTQLRGIVEAIIRSLVEQGVMNAGSRLEALYQDPDQPDSVVVEVGLQVLYPANRIKVTLFI